MSRNQNVLADLDREYGPFDYDGDPQDVLHLLTTEGVIPAGIVLTVSQVRRFLLEKRIEPTAQSDELDE